MTTTQQLSRWCIREKVPAFWGVLCSSEKPDWTHEFQARCIFNYSPCGTSGSHWLAAWKIGTTGYWFDSYGLPPDSLLEHEVVGGQDPEFLKWFASSACDRVIWNTRDLQALGSSVCGQYACFALKYGLPQFHPDAWSWVTDDPQMNDQFIRRLVSL